MHHTGTSAYWTNNQSLLKRHFLYFQWSTTSCKVFFFLNAIIPHPSKYNFSSASVKSPKRFHPLRQCKHRTSVCIGDRRSCYKWADIFQHATISQQKSNIVTMQVLQLNVWGRKATNGLPLWQWSADSLPVIVGERYQEALFTTDSCSMYS